MLEKIMYIADIVLNKITHSIVNSTFVLVEVSNILIMLLNRSKVP